MIRNIPQDQLLQAVEHHVIKVYKSSIEELEQKGAINEEVKQRAESQSNIDAMAQQAQEQAMRQQQELLEQQQKAKEYAEQQKAAQQNAQNAPAQPSNVPAAQHSSVPAMAQAISQKQMKLMSLALVMKILSQDKVTTILNKFDSADSLQISQYMNMANLESQLDGDLITDCLKEMKDFLPIKRKLTKENVLMDLLRIYKSTPREKIEKIIKNERPLVKKFVAQSYDGELTELPLRVAGIVAQYIEDSI